MASVDVKMTLSVEAYLREAIERQNKLIYGLLAIDQDQIRNEGRSAEVLRSFVDEAKNLQAAAMRQLLASTTTPDPFKARGVCPMP